MSRSPLRIRRPLPTRLPRQARRRPTFYRIPIVVHVIHRGEPVGTGYNHSVARIEAQIRVLVTSPGLGG